MSMREVKPGYWKGEIWHQGKRQTISFQGSAADAKIYEARKRIEIRSQGIIDPRTSPSFVDYCVDVYKPYAKLNVRKSTWNVRRYQLEHLVLFFDKLPLMKITSQYVERYKQHRRDEQAKRATINSELNVLSSMLTYARETLNLPCGKPKIVRLSERRKKANVRFWTPEQLKLIVDACLEHVPEIFPLVFFLAHTGARKSEAIHLPWTNVDFAQRIIRIWSEADTDDEADVEDGYQVKSSDREVPISDALLVILKEQKLKWGTSQWVFPVLQGKSKGERYAFFPKRTFNRVLRHAGVKGSPHMFRHTYASLFLANKPDLYLLSKVLGHSSYKVTEQVYAHMVPGYLDQARNVIPVGIVPQEAMGARLKVGW